MADTMQFDLVTPERKLASVAAREVRIPGADGDLTAMPDHAPLITTLRPGIVTRGLGRGCHRIRGDRRLRRNHRARASPCWPSGCTRPVR